MLSDKARTRFETRGQIELSEFEAATLATSKNVHMVLVILAVMYPVLCWDGINSNYDNDAAYYYNNFTKSLGKYKPLGCAFLAFFLGGLAGARRPTAGETYRAACKGRGTSCCIGLLCVPVMFYEWSMNDQASSSPNVQTVRNKERIPGPV